jgi:hypothetical protein
LKTMITALERILTMANGSLTEKSNMLLEEVGLKEPEAVNRLEWSGGGEKPATPQGAEDQKGTDKPWKLPGQSSQGPKQVPPPKPEYDNPKRKT